MTEGSFGVEKESLCAVKLSSRALPTNSYEFAGAGEGQGGGGVISGHRAAVVSWWALGLWIPYRLFKWLSRCTQGGKGNVAICLFLSSSKWWTILAGKILPLWEAYLLVCFFLVKFFCPFSMLLTCLITNMSFMECFILLTVTWIKKCTNMVETIIFFK